jgi:predicted PurR-regulated permease PerM
MSAQPSMRATQLQEKSAQIRLTQRRGTALINMAVAALIIAALYFGREIFVPVALAVLLSFVLAPFVIRLHSWRIPRLASVLIAVFFGFAIIFSLGGLMVSQATHLAAKLPAYQQTLSDKIDSLRGLMGGSGTLEQASTVLKELGTQLQHGDAGGNALSKQAQDRAVPIQVEVKQPDPGALTTLAKIIEPLLSPLTTTGIVVIFVAFILLQREDLRNRLVRLAGSGDIQRTTAALDDAGKRLSRLFLTQIIFNAAFGLAIGIGLEFIGVPSAPSRGRGRNRLGNGRADGALVCGSGAARRTSHRAVGLWPQFRPVARRDHPVCVILDMAVGTGRAGHGDASHRVPRRRGTACRAAQIPRNHAWRPAAIAAAATGLSADAGGRSDGGRGAGL